MFNVLFIYFLLISFVFSLTLLIGKWIETNYPNIFTELHFANHYATDGTSRTKGEICTEINAILLIDDSFHNVKSCVTHGIPTLLFGNYPWNRIILPNETHLIDNIMISRVINWKEALISIKYLLNITKNTENIEINEKQILIDIQSHDSMDKQTDTQNT